MVQTIKPHDERARICLVCGRRGSGVTFWTLYPPDIDMKAMRMCSMKCLKEWCNMSRGQKISLHTKAIMTIKRYLAGKYLRVRKTRTPESKLRQSEAMKRVWEIRKEANSTVI
jgi:hypothetical protein